MRSITIAILFALLVICGALFALRPQLDIDFSSLFYGSQGFAAADSPFWRHVRHVAYLTPSVTMGVMTLFYAARRLKLTTIGPTTRAMIFLVVSLAVGPGALVNLVLKDHAHRPRPVQTAEFGGSAAFRAWDQFDGSCAHNCSFASGEAAAAFWMTAPALLAPPPLRVLAIGAALAFGLATGLLRIAFGGHFLSDVVLAALLTLIVVALLARWLGIGRRHDEAPSSAPASPNLRRRHPTL